MAERPLAELESEHAATGRGSAVPFLGDKMRALVLVALAACAACGEPDSHPAYVAEVEAWHRERLASLARPDGWLSLAGLYWLEEGDNTFGSEATNDLVSPEGTPDRIGTFELANGVVRFQAAPAVEVRTAGDPVVDRVLATDAAGAPTVLELGRWRWHVIRRGARYGIRLKDLEHPRRLSFAGVERFPVDPTWRVSARLERYDPPRTIAVPNVLGTVTEQASPGALAFQVDGAQYRLDALGRPGDDEWWLIFADATSGQSTYGGGRFLWVPAPDSSGATIIDFNRAYNPPCAFSPFATCPLPPARNRLAVAVEAGERYRTDH